MIGLKKIGNQRETIIVVNGSQLFILRRIRSHLEFCLGPLRTLGAPSCGKVLNLNFKAAQFSYF